MIVLQVLGWAVLLYGLWRALRVGWDTWVESFTGIPPSLLPQDADPRTDLLLPSGDHSVRAGDSPALPPAPRPDGPLRGGP